MNITIERINVLPAKSCPAEVIEILKRQEKLMENIMSLTERLELLAAQLSKVKDEIIAQVGTLRTALDNAGTLPESAELALQKLEATAQALDDLNPDAADIEVAETTEAAQEAVTGEQSAEETTEAAG